MRRILPYVSPEQEQAISLAVAELGRSMALPPVIARILASRGFMDEAAANAFLHPSLEKLHDPMLLEGMAEAVETIRDALDAEIPITVYGDYDVDGVVSSAVLCNYLSGLGGLVHSYIPKRLEEGYGLNEQAIQQIAEGETGLIITVDCGITAIKEIDLIHNLGMQVVVTDHHEASELPPADAVVNPAVRPGYPFPKLCGAGVVAKLVQALGGQQALVPYLDLLALATVADIVPLVDENRILVTLGLRKLNQDPHPGLEALLQVAGLAGKKITAGQLSFGLAPRLNAGGRLGDAARGYRLLTTDDQQECMSLARELDQENQQRRKTEDEMLQQALTLAEGYEADRVLVLAAAGWHHGVAGIVASRVCERYNKPVLILCINDQHATGSGRSITGINLYEGLASVNDLFDRFGGHAMAAGLTLTIGNIDALRERLNHWCDMQDGSLWIPALQYDVALPLAAPGMVLAEQLGMLEPFGFGNKTPSFLVAGTIQDARTMGTDGSHLQFMLANDTVQLPVVAFRQAYRLEQLHAGMRYQCLVTLDVNEFRNRRSLSSRLEDICLLPDADNYLAALQTPQVPGWRAVCRSRWRWQEMTPHTAVTQEQMDRLAVRALRAEWSGTVLLVHSEQGLRRLCALLAQENLCDHVDLLLGDRQFNNADLLYNTVALSTPNWLLPLQNSRIVLGYDGTAAAFALPLISHMPKKSAFLQECGTEMSKPIGSGGTYCCTRAQIGAYYRSLRTMADQRYDDYAAFVQATQLPETLGEMALGVLGDLGLAQVSAKDGFRVFLPDAPKSDLHDSELFRIIGI